ncbi:MAG: hypothetical protein WB507_06070 [Solirubrobacterales bacterium]
MASGIATFVLDLLSVATAGNNRRMALPVLATILAIAPFFAAVIIVAGYESDKSNVEHRSIERER